MFSQKPRVIVFSSLFPKPSQPTAGVFIRERMFRVGVYAPIVIVSPQPWFPLQSVIRIFFKNFRPPAPSLEIKDSVSIYRPRFFCIPYFFKNFDGFLMAFCSFLTVRSLKNKGFNLIDSHFAYPDGYAATLIGYWLKMPVTITLRGTENSHMQNQRRRKHMTIALQRAIKIFSVSDSLKNLAKSLGISDSKIRVIGNGVDLEKFYPLDRDEARQKLDIPIDAKVLVSVGGLVERKGFHRVIACFPDLRQKFPNLYYLIVGGPSAEGDIGRQLKRQVLNLGLEEQVRFLGVLPPEQIKTPLSAANIFVLATSNEGWANVFLEAMACGLPVVTTKVGGNTEVVCQPELGVLVPFGNADALKNAIAIALEKKWDREAIQAYAQANTWDNRVNILLGEFEKIIIENNE